MDTEIQNNEALLQKITALNLYDKLVFQLQKDFNLANVEIGLNYLGHIPDSRALTTLLREKIYYLLMERFSDYLNLLYIIDIPERTFKNLKVTDAVEVADQVTFLILKRECKKVWYKTKYSS